MYDEENDVDLLCAASVKKLDILPMAAGIIVLNGCNQVLRLHCCRDETQPSLVKSGGESLKTPNHWSTPVILLQ